VPKTFSRPSHAGQDVELDVANVETEVLLPAPVDHAVGIDSTVRRSKLELVDRQSIGTECRCGSDG
jgi:hypothetical protein